MIFHSFFHRALVYICAFIGAGWFGLWAYDYGWSSDFTAVLVPAGSLGCSLRFADPPVRFDVMTHYQLS